MYFCLRSNLTRTTELILLKFCANSVNIPKSNLGLLGFRLFSPFSRLVDVISAKSWKFYIFNQIYMINGTSNQKRVLVPQTANAQSCVCTITQFFSYPLLTKSHFFRFPFGLKLSISFQLRNGLFMQGFYSRDLFM